MNWRNATRVQLCEIAYNDSEAPITHKRAALEELQRRQRPIHPKINFRKKKVYPR
ncbi:MULTISPECIES: hypothetical protein [unclassified Paenibacillus]|uniref:hypothetical protein n=1 Tax=unclassified Paenibacillus TaxID=185978 RepID=UPI002404A356|nr:MULTISPECIES: hypothetical protein [unclassified Paenibacillus]MDF9845121.1 hypothetical protein [Paenibacillus sp. PastF-2]MDF9851720.1 hypothetical protein [Paenibacillus sp. PastM-2]MDF9858327.1 hypothetical protein [Paenibacillus sp. PastF-1]MDH6483593.1 hypothetical protein [Paenibacillus sp. PastH-2]MDH6511002.1 hypothetical protein [Paenibacillus sp. PastM-3]